MLRCLFWAIVFEAYSFFFSFLKLRTESRALHLLGKCPTSELNPHPWHTPSYTRPIPESLLTFQGGIIHSFVCQGSPLHLDTTNILKKKKQPFFAIFISSHVPVIQRTQHFRSNQPMRFSFKVLSALAVCVSPLKTGVAYNWHQVKVEAERHSLTRKHARPVVLVLF